MVSTRTSGSFLLHRPRLFSTLDRMPPNGVALIVAPSGFGKTTLLHSWIGARKDPAVIVRLRDRDNDPAALTAHIWAEWSAVMAMDPCGAEAPAPLSPPKPIDHIVRHCTECQRGHLLAVDDVQRLTDPAAVAVLHGLLDEPPGRLRLLLACREEPPVPWLRLRAEGRLVEIRAAELTFADDELRAAAHAIPGLEPDDDLLSLLANSTRGWPAGVRIAALEAAAASDPAAALAEPGLGRQFAQHYFEPDVLRHLPPGTVEFLETTAAVDDLRPALCDYLTGRSDSAAVLGDLAHRGLFTERSSEAHEAFAYHPLFRDALLARLRRRDPGRYARVLVQASRWCEREGLAVEAVEYAMRAEDWDRATSLVTELSGAALAAGQVMTVARWIDAFPQAVVRADLQLTLLEASVFMLLFDRGRFRDAVRRADRMAGGRDARSADAARPVLLFLQANEALLQGRLSDTVPPLEAALSALERIGERGNPLLGPRFGRDSVESALATALLLAGKTAEAVAFADRTLAGPAEPTLTALLRALGTKSLALAWQGEEARAAELAQEAASVLDRSEVESNDPFLVHLAIVWTRSEPSRAHHSLAFVRRLAQRSGLASFQALADLAAARHALATSNRPAAERAYDQALEVSGTLEDRGILVPLTDQVARAMRQVPQPEPGGLSHRETQVLALISSGASRSQVAEALHLSVETVKTHLRRAYRKLGVDNRDAALQRAAELGIIAEPQSPILQAPEAGSQSR